MNIADLPLRKPLALYAAVIVGLAIGCSLWREVDLPDNLTTLIQWFGSITIVSYFASSTTEAVKGVGMSVYDEEEMDTVGRSVYAGPRGDSGVYDPSDTPATANRPDRQPYASHPGSRPGKPKKSRRAY